MEISTEALRLSIFYCIITLSIKEEMLISFPTNISERTTAGCDKCVVKCIYFPDFKKTAFLGRVQ